MYSSAPCGQQESCTPPPSSQGQVSEQPKVVGSHYPALQRPGLANGVCKDLPLMRPYMLFQKCRDNCTKGEAPVQERLIQPQALHSREQLMKIRDKACDRRPLIQLKHRDPDLIRKKPQNTSPWVVPCCVRWNTGSSANQPGIPLSPAEYCVFLSALETAVDPE